MEGLIGLFLLILTVAFFAGPVLAIIALVRGRRLHDAQIKANSAEHRANEIRSDLLEHRVIAVEAELAELRTSRVPDRPKRDVEAATASDTAPAEAEDAPAVPLAPQPPPSQAKPTAQQSAAEAKPAPQPPAPEAMRPAADAKPAPPAPSVEPPARPPWDGPPSRPSVKVDWERWIGIRGAAVLGAVALGLAGLLFFKYSIETGMITPTMRVVFGTLTGLGCLVGSEWLRKRLYAHTAEGVAGAGVVILYAAFWAAYVMYHLIGMTFAFGLMVLVTLACCLLAVRRNSLTIAVIGLVGGFATPLLLSSGSDRPIGLFGYVLLLDLGLLTVGHKRRWPSLGILSLLATVLLQGLWVGARMGPDRLFLGLAILAVFGALFVFSGRLGSDRGSRGAWWWSQLGAILFPFAFALYFAGRVELGEHLYPIAILLALLCAAAGWLAREQGVPAIAVGAATASVAVVGVWLLQHALTQALAWETVAVAAGLSTIFHFFVERSAGRNALQGPAAAALAAVLGFFVLLLLSASVAAVSPWPWLAGWAALAGLLYRHAVFPERGVLQVAGAVGVGLGLSLLHGSGQSVLPAAPMFLALLVVAAVASHVIALNRRLPVVREFGDHAAAALPVVLLLGLVPAVFTQPLGPLPALGTTLILGVLALLAATRLGNGAWYAVTVGATFLAQFGWLTSRPGLREQDSESLAALGLGMLTVIVFTLWPLLTVKRFSAQRFAWYAAALAGPLWFMPLQRLFEASLGDAYIGVLPVALGALSLVAVVRVRKSLTLDDPRHFSALVWFAAVALCFLAVAIPLQLEKEWVTLGWALEGLAVLALWKRLDHPGLKYFGLALFGAVTVRLVANPALLGYYPRSTMHLLNWLLYTYLVPAAALLGGASLLRPREVQRARPWERPLYAGGHAVGAVGSGLAAIAVIFMWINLAIADWFATGPALTLSFGDRPAQRLTVSIAWAIYALVLLGFGMARNSLGLRWLSLGFLLFTIGKVFLYDLGALEDLYRVASLVGLAASLILVSLLYQRFVFRKARREAAEEGS